MKKPLILFCCFAFAVSVSGQSDSVRARVIFIAHDEYLWMSSPRNPRQNIIGEVVSGTKFSKGTTIKLIYLPEVKSKQENVEYLASEVLNGDKQWEVVLRPPTKFGEQMSCDDMDNYFRVGNKKRSVVTGPNSNPATRFRSTKFDGYIVLDKLENIPCFVLESFSRYD